MCLVWSKLAGGWWCRLATVKLSLCRLLFNNSVPRVRLHKPNATGREFMDPRYSVVSSSNAKNYTRHSYVMQASSFLKASKCCCCRIFGALVGRWTWATRISRKGMWHLGPTGYRIWSVDSVSWNKWELNGPNAWSYKEKLNYLGRFTVTQDLDHLER